MNIIFIGSGALACPALETVLARPADRVVAVVTQPERPRGRHLHVAACPVKALAERLGVPVHTPEKASDPVEIGALADLQPDLILVTAYGQFLKPALLAIAPLGALNIHPSLLPKYRGAAPIQWAVANGETRTGVSLLYVTERMDAGDLLAQEEAPIGDEDTAATLEPRLAALGAQLLDRTLDALAAGRASRRAQDEAQVTFAPKLTKEDGHIDWTRPAAAIRNRIRGFSPWPGCFTFLPGERPLLLRIHAARAESAAGEPGRILEAGAHGLVVAAGEGALRRGTVQPEGRTAMPGAAFCCGHRDLAGLRLE